MKDDENLTMHLSLDSFIKMHLWHYKSSINPLRLLVVSNNQWSHSNLNFPVWYLIHLLIDNFHMNDVKTNTPHHLLPFKNILY